MSVHVSSVIVRGPEEQAEAFGAMLQERLGDAAQCLISPVVRIVPLPLERDAGDYQTLIFTSANGVHALGINPALAGRTAYCVGERTAAAARDAGFTVVTAQGNADDLADLILRDCPPGPWLHASGEHTRGNLADRLHARGHRTDHAIVYRQDAVALSDAAIDAISTRRVILPVFSPRTAGLLSEMIPVDAPEPDVAAISSAAAEHWRGPVRRLAIAAQPNSDAMLDILGMLVRTDSQS